MLEGIRLLWQQQVRSSKQTVCVSKGACLYRNLAGYPFTSHTHLQQRLEILDTLRAAFHKLPGFSNDWVELAWKDCSHNERALLKKTCGLQVPCEETTIWYHKKHFTQIIVHDINHIRFRITRPDGTLKHCVDQLMNLESALDTHLDFAFDPQIGYVNSAPFATGTGLSAWALLHLPGLCLRQQVADWVQTLKKVNLCLTPMDMAQSKVVGHLFYLANDSGLGCSESQLITQIESMCAKMVMDELQARKELVSKRSVFVKDSVGRALGLLQNCCELSYDEATELVSVVVLGIHTNLLSHQHPTALKLLWRSLSNEYLEAFTQKQLTPEQASLVRAQLLKSYCSKNIHWVSEKKARHAK